MSVPMSQIYWKLVVSLQSNGNIWKQIAATLCCSPINDLEIIYKSLQSEGTGYEIAFRQPWFENRV